MAKKKPHFIKGAIQDPGYLHRATHTPPGQKIPPAKVAAAAHQTKNPHLEHAAEMAETLGHMDHNHSRDHKFGAPKKN